MARHWAMVSPTASAPGLLNPMRLTIAASGMARKIRGEGLPGCGSQVTAPNSVKPNPSAGQAGGGSGIFTQPRRESNRVGKMQTENVAWEFGRSKEGLNRAAKQVPPADP